MIRLQSISDFLKEDRRRAQAALAPPDQCEPPQENRSAEREQEQYELGRQTAKEEAEEERRILVEEMQKNFDETLKSRERSFFETVASDLSQRLTAEITAIGARLEKDVEDILRAFLPDAVLSRSMGELRDTFEILVRSYSAESIQILVPESVFERVSSVAAEVGLPHEHLVPWAGEEIALKCKEVSVSTRLAEWSKSLRIEKGQDV